MLKTTEGLDILETDEVIGVPEVVKMSVAEVVEISK